VQGPGFVGLIGGLGETLGGSIVGIFGVVMFSSGLGDGY